MGLEIVPLQNSLDSETLGELWLAEAGLSADRESGQFPRISSSKKWKLGNGFASWFCLLSLCVSKPVAEGAEAIFSRA